MNPTSEAAAKLERAWEGYYERFDIGENQEQLVMAMMEPLNWQGDRAALATHAHTITRILFENLVEALPSEARIALLVGYDLIPSFEKWNEERP